MNHLNFPVSTAFLKAHKPALLTTYFMGTVFSITLLRFWLIKRKTMKNIYIFRSISWKAKEPSN